MKLSVVPFMRSDERIDKVLWDVCSLVNKVKDGDDKRLDALKWGLIVLWWRSLSQIRTGKEEFLS